MQAYKALRSHPQDHIARKARHMLFGFQAAETMGVQVRAKSRFWWCNFRLCQPLP